LRRHHDTLHISIIPFARHPRHQNQATSRRASEDASKAGVIDQTKVTRTALQNAAGVATFLLTSDALIAEAPKKDKKGSGAPGHGGMDDMY
jgi:chaperonin GroEL (HSP60 family)